MNRTKFIAPSSEPLKASKELQEQLKKDVQHLIELGALKADLEDHRRALKELEKRFNEEK